MKCKVCGTEFTEGVFCPECGARFDAGEKNAKVENQTAFHAESEPQQVEAENKSEKKQKNIDEKEIKSEKKESVKSENPVFEKHDDGKAFSIVSLVCGIISICSMGLLIVPEILGIVFAFLSKKKKKMSGMAKAGLICSIVGIIIPIIVAIVLLTSGSDKTDSAQTNESVSATEEDVKQEDTVQIKDISGYLGMSEDDLVETLGISKNDLGFYPDDSNINFTCTDGVVDNIILDVNHENADAQYTLFGLKIGEATSDISEKLADKFELVSSDPVATDGGMFDSYKNKENGYILAVSYINDKITQISYVMDNAENSDMTEDNNIDDSTTGEAVSEIVYGKYKNYNESYMCDAEVGFYTDEEGSDYVTLEGVSVGNHGATGAETYTLYLQDDGTYLGEGEYGSTAYISFGENSMTVDIIYAEMDDDYNLSGTYKLTEKLDLSNVG